MFSKFKIVYSSILFFLFITTAFTQNANVKTEFIEDGNLYQTQEKSSKILTTFKEFDKCAVIGYVGKYTYKVKFKGYEGFVKDRFILVNEAVMDLYFDYEEEQKQIAIQERGTTYKEKIAQQKKNQDSIKLVNKQRIADSLNQLKLERIRKENADFIAEQQRLEQLRQKQIQDSIQKAKAEQLRIQAEAEKAEKLRRKQLRQKQIQDSTQKAKAEKLRLQAEAEKAEKLRLEQLKQKQIQDSIQRAKAEQLRIQAVAEKAEKLRLEQLRQKQIQDSIQKAKAEQLRIQAEAEKAEKLRREQLRQKQIQDSIQKAKAEQFRIQQEAEKAEKLRRKQLKQKQIQDSIQRAKAEQLRLQQEAEKAEKLRLEQLRQKQIQDSIQKAKAEQLRIQGEAEKAEKLRLEQLRQKQIQDSITRMQNTNAPSIDSEYRNTCHYFINEYDSFYKQQLIITDKYPIANKLNIELLREGNTLKIHFNYSENLGCVNYVPNRRSSVRVTLANNNVIVFYHSGSLDCNFFSLKAIIPSSKINQLKSVPIKSIMLKGTGNSVIISDIDYKTFFIDKLKCLDY